MKPLFLFLLTGLLAIGSFAQGARQQQMLIGTSATPTWPALSAFSTNNFLDHFPGSSLNARWTSVTSGTGSVIVSDSNADMNAPASSAAFIYYNTKLDKTKSQLWTASISYPTSGVATVSPRFLSVLNGAGTPAADTSSNINSRSIFRFDYSNIGTADVAGPSYYNNSDVQTFWNAATPAWTTTYPGANFYALNPIRQDDYYIVGFEIDAPGSRWRTMGWAQTYTSGYSFSEGYRLFFLSDWVTWANTRSSADLWLSFGIPFNDDSAAHEGKLEWIRYSESVNNKVVDAWFDNSGTNGGKQQTRHYYSYDGYIYLPEDRTTYALALGGSTYDDLDISPPSAAWNGASTDYLAYQASGSVTTSSINMASATHTSPQNNTWTKSANNPVIILGADETFVGFPFLFKDNSDADSNKRWKILFSVKKTSDSKWRMHLATSPDPPTGATWTRQGVILDVGAGGAADEIAARDGIPIYYGGQWEVWYEGWNASGYTSLMRATGVNFTTLTKDGAGARITYQANGDTTLTASLTGRTVTVTSTTGFSIDGLVALCQSNVSGAAYNLSRVRKVISSTQLELYHGLDGWTTATPARIAQIDSVRYFSPRNVVKVGSEWWFYINVWGTFNVYDGTSYSAYRNQLQGLWKHSAANPTGAPPAIDFLSFPVAQPGFSTQDDQTVENMTLLMPPFN